MHIRTCWLDDCVETFVQSLDNDETGRSKRTSDTKLRGTVVILGSGFDTRCYRLSLNERNLQLFEVRLAVRMHHQSLLSLYRRSALICHHHEVLTHMCCSVLLHGRSMLLELRRKRSESCVRRTLMNRSLLFAHVIFKLKTGLNV